MNVFGRRVCLAFATVLGLAMAFVTRAADITPAEARAIAKEAYTYGFPMVDSYRIQYAYFVDPKSPEYKGTWNEVHNFARVFTPEDRAVQTPNSDTPYSFLGIDLRAEPIVLTVPAVEQDRYFSVQLIDLYTFNFDYIGSRATGNDGGSFLIAGPGWKGEAPKGVKKIIRCETELALGAFRTQLFNPADIENVKKVQAGYRVQPLSAFLGQPAPQAAPPIQFVKPLTAEQEKSSLEFFEVLNFVLGFCPTHPSEVELMARFARIGVGAGRSFDSSSLSPEIRAAIEKGIADSWEELAGISKRMDAKEITSGDTFGTREYLKNNYAYRMAAAKFGIYGNSKMEAIYPIYGVDAEGEKLSGANGYTIRFAPGELPPVRGFWSLTMYGMPESLLVANPLNRYLLNSPMMPQFKMDADGGLTFYIQNESPGKDNESNWLPAPKGPFIMVMRLYWPKPEALEGTWTAPALTRVK